MKKLILSAAIVAASAFSVIKATETNKEDRMSDLQLANVEALADALDSKIPIACRYRYGSICYFQGYYLLDHEYVY